MKLIFTELFVGNPDSGLTSRNLLTSGNADVVWKLINNRVIQPKTLAEDHSFFYIPPDSNGS